jgi:hypothetical protein
VLLIPKDADPWDLMADSLGQFKDDFMKDRSQPAQGLIGKPCSLRGVT